MILNIPAKTFLVGEYSVLLGGSAIGLATKPCFEVQFSEEHNDFQLHPESAAAQYLKTHKRKENFKIVDPYQGGFGRSTAEYLAAIAPDILAEQKEFSKLFKEYKSFHSGSGVDLAFQYFGQVCLADPAIGFYQTFNWHFPHLDFFILSTGLKIKTHEHIKSLQLQNLKDLPILSDEITRVYAENKEENFLELMKDWCDLLRKHNLTHENSLRMKNELECFEPIQLAKPCGALGADVMLVFFDKNQAAVVKKILLENNYQIRAHSSDLTEGFRNSLSEYRRLNVG